MSILVLALLLPAPPPSATRPSISHLVKDYNFIIFTAFANNVASLLFFVFSSLLTASDWEIKPIFCFFLPPHSFVSRNFLFFFCEKFGLLDRQLHKIVSLGLRSENGEGGQGTPCPSSWLLFFLDNSWDHGQRVRVQGFLIYFTYLGTK